METPTSPPTEKKTGLRGFMDTVRGALYREKTSSPETALTQAQTAIDKYIGSRADEPNFLELVSGDNGGPQLIQMMKNSIDAQYRQVLHPSAPVGEQEGELAQYAQASAFRLIRKRSQ